MRACQPDTHGYVDSRGVKIGYEVFGDGDPTILLLPTWTIVNARFWKAQIPYLARHFRVVAFDGPGNGRSDRVVNPDAYTAEAYAAAAVDVLDATDTERAVHVSLSAGANSQLKLMAEHPGRCVGGVFIGPSLPFTPNEPDRVTAYQGIDDPPPTTERWWKYNRHRAVAAHGQRSARTVVRSPRVAARRVRVAAPVSCRRSGCRRRPEGD